MREGELEVLAWSAASWDDASAGGGLYKDDVDGSGGDEGV